MAKTLLKEKAMSVYHPQTGKFLATVAQNMPPLPAAVMRYWIEHPAELESALTQALAKRWREENGVIYFTVTSDGTTGHDWITRLEQKGCHLSAHSRQHLCSIHFYPRSAVTYRIAVLKGSFFQRDTERVTRNIRAEASRQGWLQGDVLNTEIACLIRDAFSDEDLEAMGLWGIVIMHDPLPCPIYSCPFLLSVRSDGDGQLLHHIYASPDEQFNCRLGFACLLPESPSVSVPRHPIAAF